MLLLSLLKQAAFNLSQPAAPGRLLRQVPWADTLHEMVDFAGLTDLRNRPYFLAC
jgi:hypothetical protein